jgi:hypothetical protein
MKTVKMIIIMLALMAGGRVLAQGYCLTFGPGCNSYVTVPNSDSLFFSDSFTVECWFTTHGQHLNDHIPLVSTFPPTAASGAGWLIGLLEPFGQSLPTQVNCAYYDDFYSDTNSFYQNTQPDVWHHLAMSYDGQDVRLFTDGQLAYIAANVQIPYHNNGQPMTIGGQSGSFMNRNLNGNMDEVRLSNTCRYTSGFFPQISFVNDSYTVALYHLDEGTGSIAHDASGHGHDGNIVGATWTSGGPPPPPPLDVNFSPLSMRITIPNPGGSFNFDVLLRRNLAPQAPYTVWARIKNPDGSYTNPTLGPVTINTPVNLAVSRIRTQSVPGSWSAGQYWYIGYANNSYAYPAIDSTSFPFTKLATGRGPTVWDASCSGEPFPGEVISLISSQPSQFVMQSAYPNPFNPTTTISFTLPEANRVTLSVYDISGKLVTTLVDGYREAGVQQVTFDGSNLASGIYFCRIQASNLTAMQKLVLMK